MKFELFSAFAFLAICGTTAGLQQSLSIPTLSSYAVPAFQLPAPTYYFKGASAVHFDKQAKTLYSANYDGTVMKLDQGSTTPTTFASGVGQIFGICVDPVGNIYVSSRDGGLHKYSASGVRLFIDTTGIYIYQIYCGKSGHVYIPEARGQMIRTLAPDRTYTHLIGLNQAGSFPGGSVPATEVVNPRGIVMNAAEDTIFIVQTYGLRIVKNGYTAMISALPNLAGIWMNAQGDVYVSNGRITVLKNDFNGQYENAVMYPIISSDINSHLYGFIAPDAICGDDAGSLYVADSGVDVQMGKVVQLFDPSFAPPSMLPSVAPTAAPSSVPQYSLTVSAKSFKYFEVRVFTGANERVFPLSYELVDCPENAGAVIWGHESTPITENTNTCVYGLPRHYWCECPALANGNKPKLTLNFGGTVFDRVELLILDWVDGAVTVSDSANNIVLFSASRAGGPLAGEEFVGYDHLNLLQVAPSVVPTVTPSSVPTTKPSWTPTVKPTIPSIVPTQTPTAAPTTTAPSAVPSVTPSMVPSVAPSFTAQYTITLTAKTFKYFEVRVYTHDNLRIFPVSYELDHCPENAGIAVWNEQTTEDTNTCVYGYPRSFWCQCATIADAKPKLVLHMGHTVFDRVELLLLNWEDGEVTVTDEANHETFLSATHDGVGTEFVTFGNLNLEHAAAPVRRLLRGG